MNNQQAISDKTPISNRVLFRSRNSRQLFFLKLRKKFGSLKNLREYFGIYRSRLDAFKSGNISLPYETYIILCSHLSYKDKQYFSNKIIIKDKNWGRVKGGVATYKIHRHIFEKGREIAGIKKGNCRTKYTFNLGMPLTNELCELLGAFIGDGFTNKYAGAYMTQFTGHPKLDREYYLECIMPIIKKIGPNSNPIIAEKPDSIRLTVYSKELYNLLTCRFNFIAGKKVYSVVMPGEILNSKDQACINRCVRGIFDTDGHVFFDKRQKYRGYYIRIGLHMMSKSLINQVYSILLSQEIKATINRHSTLIQINGQLNCKRFMDLIGFSNSRHINKIDKSLFRQGNLGRSPA